MDIAYRPRRMRRTPGLRAMVREHHVSAADFIYPLFVHEGATNEPIGAMPGAQPLALAMVRMRKEREGRETIKDLQMSWSVPLDTLRYHANIL